ncbi:MAG: serine--tRNA ligase [Candidatus Bathyarchaeia archaeon]|jgi:seryl-tRNA synthetase|nr:serine--tRNA ligase [Candidatus Bathyarchaeota archaeon A05DMB-4]MDH7596048.1 serine--tRNA ligase [Candidatus Bathyarchaeota archaeon]
MLDIKLIRENPDLVRQNIGKRGDAAKLKMLDELIHLDKEWRQLLTQANELRHKRREITVEIAELKKMGKDVASKIKDAKKVDNEILTVEKRVNEYRQKADTILVRLPNLLHESVPFGKDDNDNVEIRRWGKPPKFDFEPKSHLEILENLGMIDAESAGKVAGSMFFYLKGPIVLLDFALQRFAINHLMRRGFQVVWPPLMVNRKVYEGMIGDPSDFAEASYKVEDEELYLIPTAEYPLGGMFIDTTFAKDDLPVKLCGVSVCFRREVGSHGKFSKGLFRMHQFNKVELLVFCLPEDSWNFHEELQAISESLYQQLGLHYRVVNVCTGDIGAKAAKKYDTEAWMADGKFREVGSNSNCTDYQARSLNIKYREKEGQPPKGFVHILNNTALATSRTMIAILEQYQQKDGSVIIPKVLRPYMGGMERLEKQ